MKRKWLVVGVLGVFELLVCTGMLLSLWAVGPTLGQVRWFYVTDTHVEETIEETFVVEGPATIDLDAEYGDVTVTAGEGDEVHVVARLDLWGVDEEDARQQVDVQISQEGERIVIRATFPEWHYVGAVTHSSRVDFEIVTPFPSSARLVTSSGDLTVIGITGGVNLDTSFGDVEIEDVGGPVEVRSSSGTIVLDGLDEGGVVTLDTEFGDLIVSDVMATSLVLNTSSGDVELEDGTFETVVDLATNFGKVTIRDVTGQEMIVRSESGKIHVENVTLERGLDVETSFGDVTVTGTGASSYRLRSESGSLVLDGGRGGLDLHTGFGDIEVSNVEQAVLTLETSSGQISFSGGLSAEGDHVIDSGFGDVKLILPADAAFDLDAETGFGSVSTDFPVTVSHFDEQHLVGAVNGGGRLLEIYTSSGTITLESSEMESGH